MTSKIKVNILADGGDNSIITSDGAGSFTASSSLASSVQSVGGIQMTPAFEAYLSSDTSLSENVTTVLPCDTEVYDTDNCYNTSTYAFTPNVAGKYYIYGSAYLQSGGDAYKFSFVEIYLNDSLLKRSLFNPQDTSVNTFVHLINGIVDMNGTTDSVNLQVRFSSSVSRTLYGSTRGTYFGAYKVIGA